MSFCSLNCAKPNAISTIHVHIFHKWHLNLQAVFAPQFSLLKCKSRCNLHHICKVQFAILHFWSEICAKVQIAWSDVHKIANCTLTGANPSAICTSNGAKIVQFEVQTWCKLHLDLHFKSANWGANMVQIAPGFALQKCKLRCKYGANCTWICTSKVQIVVQIQCKLHLDLHFKSANWGAKIVKNCGCMSLLMCKEFSSGSDALQNWQQWHLVLIFPLLHYYLPPCPDVDTHADVYSQDGCDYEGPVFRDWDSGHTTKDWL